MKHVGRSDFLKLITAAAGGSALRRLAPGLTRSAAESAARPNILLIVFDATSATNMSLHGYPRPTTPNLERLAERAIVYHNHYANGNFTSSGTASLLSGMLPWTHRAMGHSATVLNAMEERNVFTLLQPKYFTAAATQNEWANLLLHQMSRHINQHLPKSALGLIRDPIRDWYFRNDAVAAFRTYQGILGQQPPNVPNALVLSFVLGGISERWLDALPQSADDPGFAQPGMFEAYTVRAAMAAFLAQLEGLRSAEKSYFAYYHFLFPHDPYCPGLHFTDFFLDDGITWRHKRAHTLSQGSAEAGIVSDRRRYDEYLANIDAEFGRLMDDLDARGLLDNTFVFLTSDHGEMFERGEIGHNTALLYEPVVRIPLLVWPPGRASRQDIFALTSNVDILPTLLGMAGLDIPGWCEGRPLPGLGGAEDPSRGVFVVEAKATSANRPLRRATVALVNEDYKLIRYKGYVGRYADYYEFYELGDDREEMKNLAESGGAPKVFRRMQDELLTRWAEADRPFGGS